MIRPGFLLPSLSDRGPTFWMPSQASTVAGDVDWVFYLVYWISVFFFALITFLMVLFIVKYRRRQEGEDTGSARAHGHNTALEIMWSVIPTLLVVVIFWFGFTTYMNMASPPGNSYEVLVTGQKWKWLFTYPNGAVDENLHVPADVPVRLVMTSEDVIHSFFVPDFRVKKDVVPGRYNKTWFRAPKSGEYPIYCAEYCGTSHSDMLAKVVVHDQAAFDRWLEDAGNFLDKMTPAEGGERLYNQRGCKQCHSVDGKPGIGPTFQGIFGHAQPLRDGTQVTVDEDYIRESILNPAAKVAAGYEPVMPTYQGRLKDKEITALIEYIKSLGGEQGAPQ